MKFYLCNRADGSQFITEELPTAMVSKPQQAVEATSWLDAKRQMGFHLTPLQELVLSERSREAA